MKRNSSFDIIRIFSIWFIVTCHFAVPLRIRRLRLLYFGFLGNTLFFMLSGYLLRMSFNRNQNLKTFYKKRFLSIFPILEVAFVIFYVLTSLRLNNFLYGGSLYKILYSFLGIDSYMLFFDPVNYQVTGEWFTAAILVLYLIFPVLYYLMRKRTWLITTVVLGLCYNFFYPFKGTPVSSEARIMVVLFFFWIGMSLEWLSEKVTFKGYWLILLIPIIVVIISLNRSTIRMYYWIKPLCTTSVFMSLLIIFSKIRFGAVSTKIVTYLSRISYSIYLVHHEIINYFFQAGYGKLITNSPLQFIVFYLTLLIIILLAAIIVYQITEIIMAWIGKAVKRLSPKEKEIGIS